eukprot:5838920-Pleurochrysis_carterae.AAC.1
MAFITRGEAVFNDHFAHVRGETETQAIFIIRGESTSGAAMTAELLHARFNHRRAEVIKLLPQCTRDAPDARATLARNIACEDCLRGNSDA